ncbi:MAG: lysoplasmalogenase [Clostridia bacterium]|nr:lysoplasmalogenase [Clostridia bacterium]
MKIHRKLLLGVNALFVAVILALNYLYQSQGFDFTLKCICSGLFALLGVIDLVYALVTKRKKPVFYITMSLGLILAFLGDCLINQDFIVGAAAFALGHIFFVVAYCIPQRIKALDCAISGGIFLASAAFLLFCPLLDFGRPLFQGVCLVYALMISFMLGKAIGNLVRTPCLHTATVAVASGLFFFSDLMLVLDWFIGLWSWTDHACMGTYYPALCLLAVSMALRSLTEGEC